MQFLPKPLEEGSWALWPFLILYSTHLSGSSHSLQHTPRTVVALASQASPTSSLAPGISPNVPVLLIHTTSSTFFHPPRRSPTAIRNGKA